MDSKYSVSRRRMFFSEGTLVSKFASRFRSVVETRLSNFVALSASSICSRPPDAAPVTCPYNNISA